MAALYFEKQNQTGAEGQLRNRHIIVWPRCGGLDGVERSPGGGAVGGYSELEPAGSVPNISNSIKIWKQIILLLRV